MNIAPWKFKNNTNTITFKTEYIEYSYCTVNIIVYFKNINTTAKNDEQALALLQSFNFPIKKK